MSKVNFADEFTKYSSLADLSARYDAHNLTGSNAALTSGGRGGRQAVKLNGSGTVDAAYFERVFQTNLGTFSFSARIVLGATWQAATAVFLNFWDGASYQLRVGASKNGLTLYRATSVALASYSRDLSAGGTFYLEGQITVADSGGSVICYLYDGSTIVQCFNFSGDTQATANAYCTKVRFSNTYADITLDDIVILNDGSRPSGGRGATYVDYKSASSAGNYSQYTASSGTLQSDVDDMPANDDTDYIYDGTSGHRASFGCNALSGVGDILSVQSIAKARWDTGSSDIKLGLRRSSTNYVGSAVGLTGAYKWKEGTWYDTDPSTSAPWIESDVNATEALVETV